MNSPLPRPSGVTIFARVILTLAACTSLYLLATVPLEWKQQAVFGLGLFFLAVIIGKVSSSKFVTLFISVLSLFSTVRYAHYRFAATFNYLSFNWAEAHAIDLCFVFILLTAESYAFVILFLGVFQTIRPLQRPSLPLPDDSTQWPTVDIYIPTYNEPLEVVRASTLAAMNIDWPADKLKVYILDDGKRREFWEFAKVCEIGYIVRPDNKHAKAGNINHALRQTDGEYIAFFDCDHIPTRSFLQVAMGWFGHDERLAMVQTPHHFYSPDPFERNLDTFRQIPNEGALFYGVIQDGSDFWNASFFCGSCAVIRRTALEEVGGIAVETVTEDSHTALRLHRRGWNTAYIRFPQAAGLATASLAAHIGQRIRWARGMVQILRTDNPLFGRGLKISQRLCYVNSMMHYLFAIPRLIFIVSTAVYLLLGRSNIYGYGEAILAYALPHLAFAVLMNSRVQGKYRYSFWNEVYETVLAPFILLPTTIALISPKHGKWNVTSKEEVIDQRYFDWKLAAPYLCLLSLNIACVVAGVVKALNGTSNQHTIALNTLWSLLNIVILGAAVAVAHEATQRRSSIRIATRIPVAIARGEHRWNTTTVDISRGGVAIPLPADWDLNPGERLRSIFNISGEEHTFPMVLIANEEGNARFSFGVLSLEKEDALVRLIFGRADAWLNWRENAREDRPLLSFFNIMGIALQGISVIPRATIALLNRPARPPRKPVDLVMRRLIAPPVLLAALGLGSLLLAPAGQLRADDSTAAATFNDALDLAAMGHNRALALHGSQGYGSLTFGIPLTKVVTEATLLLNYRVSIGLAEKVSVVNILLNGTPVATLPVTQPPVPESVIALEIQIPADLLTSDNTLALTLDGRCSPGCNGGTAAELWLEVEPSTQLHLRGSVLALRNDLSLLPEPFFDSSSRGKVTAQIAFEENPDHKTLEAAGVIASWFGQLADHRSLRFSVTVGSIPSGNVIVFAQRHSELASALGLDSSDEPLVALRDNPANAFGKILVITGGSSDDLLTAARALATGRYPRAGDSASLSSFRLPPPRDAYDAPRWLNTSHSTPLGQHLSSDDLTLYGNGSVRLYFQLPPDLYFGTQQYVPLHLVYDLVKWPTNVNGELRIRLNETLITTRAIHDATVNRRQVQDIGLPVAALTLGNTLRLEFSIDSKGAPDSQTLEESVSAASAIDLSGLAHFVELPRLDLFANAGFPFTKYGDLAGTAVVLGDDAAPPQIGFYLDVLGFFGARTGYPALRVTVVSPAQTAEAAGKDLLILGTGPHESEWIEKLIAGPASVSQGQIRLRDSSSPLSKFPWLAWFSPDGRRGAQEVFTADPGPDGFLSEFSSPLSGDHTAVAIQALDIAKLDPLEDVFAGEATIAQVYGSLSVFQGGQVHSFILEPRSYALGQLAPVERFHLWVSSYYWILPLLLIAITALLAAKVNGWLEERARFRLQTQQ
jgi:cellulose synthase (UDP-forming)